jgi:hypothetical protein
MRSIAAPSHASEKECLANVGFREWFIKEFKGIAALSQVRCSRCVVIIASRHVRYCSPMISDRDGSGEYHYEQDTSEWECSDCAVIAHHYKLFADPDIPPQLAAAYGAVNNGDHKFLAAYIERIYADREDEDVGEALSLDWDKTVGEMLRWRDKSVKLARLCKTRGWPIEY